MCAPALNFAFSVVPCAWDTILLIPGPLPSCHHSLWWLNSFSSILSILFIWHLFSPPVLLLICVCMYVLFLQLDCELLKGRAMTYTSLYPQCLAYSKHSNKYLVVTTCSEILLFPKGALMAHRQSPCHSGSWLFSIHWTLWSGIYVTHSPLLQHT